MAIEKAETSPISWHDKSGDFVELICSTLLTLKVGCNIPDNISVLVFIDIRTTNSWSIYVFMSEVCIRWQLDE